ncbi:MAG: DUF4922 domain-containing protein [Hyphomicrobiales bacterium]|nr:DUF4922 domain-containing protein [Hyphomicrobiales bacterium]
MPQDFERRWSELNARLLQIEQSAGLAAALAELQSHQRQSGFIKDRLDDVERHSFHHPDDPSKILRAQYNPKRALRFGGSGARRTPSDGPVRNDGCYLCRDNIQWQQQGAQLGYDIRVGDNAYVALMNPFPLLPGHVVIALRDHRSQDWLYQDGGGLEVSALLHDLVALANRMPGYVGFYNGVDAGASIPGHLHFQFFRRPEGEPDFPLERAARHDRAVNGHAELAGDYPLPVALWKGEPEDVVARASAWVSSWGDDNKARLNGLTANFIAAREADGENVTLYFVPRDRARPRGKGLSGLIGGLEVLGEIVLSCPEEKGRLDAGLIDYFALEDALASVGTPFFVE